MGSTPQGGAAVSKTPMNRKEVYLERPGPLMLHSDSPQPPALSLQPWGAGIGMTCAGLFVESPGPLAQWPTALKEEARQTSPVLPPYLGRPWIDSPCNEDTIKAEPAACPSMSPVLNFPPASGGFCGAALESALMLPRHLAADPFADLHMPWLPALDAIPLQPPSPCPELDRSDSSADSPWDIRALHRSTPPLGEAFIAQSHCKHECQTPSPSPPQPSLQTPKQYQLQPQHTQPSKAPPTEEYQRSTRLRSRIRRQQQQQQRKVADHCEEVSKPLLSTASSSARQLRKRAARLELRGARLVLASASKASAQQGNNVEECTGETGPPRHKGSDRGLSPLPDAGRCKKQHNPWSVDEISALIEGVQRCGAGRWADIKKLGLPELPRRSAVDLKDKWRNLVRVAALPPTARRAKSDRRREVPSELLQLVRQLVRAASAQKAHASRHDEGAD